MPHYRDVKSTLFRPSPDDGCDAIFPDISPWTSAAFCTRVPAKYVSRKTLRYSEEGNAGFREDD
jgi:hypothetical protein